MTAEGDLGPVPGVVVEGADGGAPLAAGDDVEPVTEPVTELDAVRAELAAMGASLAALVGAREAADERARARELVIAHQRDELDALRAERRGGHLRPLVVALQKLRAELLAEAARSAPDDPGPAGPAAAATGPAATFGYFAEVVLDVLERCGCRRLPVVLGDALDRGEHQVVRTEPAGPEDHGRVVAVLAEGWADGESGRVLAPTRVVVGRHRPPEPPPDPTPGPTEPSHPSQPEQPEQPAEESSHE